MNDKRPYLAIASLLAPVPVLVFFWLLETNPRLGAGLNGYAGMLFAIALYVGGAVAVCIGCTCAIVSLVRERARTLAVAGLALNLLLPILATR